MASFQVLVQHASYILLVTTGSIMLGGVGIRQNPTQQRSELGQGKWRPSRRRNA